MQNKEYPSRLDMKLNATAILRNPLIKGGSIVYLDGQLLREGIDNHYTLEDGVLELHIDFFPGTYITLLNYGRQD